LQAASFTPYGHYSLLRTIEDSWHLGCLANTCDTEKVPAMNDLVDRRRWALCSGSVRDRRSRNIS
jgi:hypothetical protein